MTGWSVRERRTLAAMVSAVAGLHVLGFAALFAFGGPSGHHAAGGGALTIGVGIDTTTRKLMADGDRPLSVGFWFSLGHSTIVFVLALGISIGARALNTSVTDPHSSCGQDAATTPGSTACSTAAAS